MAKRDTRGASLTPSERRQTLATVPRPNRRSVAALIGGGAASLFLTGLRPSAVLAATPYQAKVRSLFLRPSKPTAGTRTVVIMRVETVGRGIRSIPWEIKIDNRVVARGTRRNVKAGSRFDVSAGWTATGGLHNFLGTADPRNTLREVGRERYDNGQGFSIRIAAASTAPTTRSTVPSRSLTPTTRGTTPRRSAPSMPFLVRIDSISVTPTVPLKGQTATIRVRARAYGSGRKSVSYRIKRPGQSDYNGTKTNVSSGSTFDISVPWQPNGGRHKVAAGLDPNNTLGEPSSLRSDNVKDLNVLVTDWPQWAQAAIDGAVKGIRMWQLTAHFRNVKIMATSAIGAPGCLTGPSIRNYIRNEMRTKGCPNDIADDFADAISKAFKDWQDKVTIPGLPWYPAFAAFPGPQAPPMPNVPTPLVSLVSSKVGAMAPPALKIAIEAKLGSMKNLAGAQPAISLVATKIGGRFSTWLAANQVKLVMGKGPVPTFAPPYVPVGPVQNGSVLPNPGSLNGYQFPNAP